MKRLSAFLLLLLSFSVSALAQQAEDEPYYPYAESEERIPDPLSDSTLFYRAVRSATDLYGSLTDYNLPRVTIRRRGEERSAHATSLMGITCSYRHLTLARALGGVATMHAGVSAGPAGRAMAGEGENYEFDDALPLMPYAASVRLVDRNYRLGGRVLMNQEIGPWQVGAALDVTMGADLRMEGVYTRSLLAAVRLSRAWASGASWTLYGTIPLVERGLRSSSTEEAFRLVEDPYYNPSWGFREGEVFNARVRRERLPFLATSFQYRLGESTMARVSLGGEYGQQRQSALGWYDARSPLPDNYRYMPSYTEDRASEEAWRSADPRYTQINWDELVAQNCLRNGEAIYTLEDRVTRVMHLSLVADVSHRVGAVELDGGVRADVRNDRYYKQMRDLLGAQYLTDIDYYLVDDDSYSNRLQNNLRDPGRRIGEGDRFGYDYALRQVDATVWAHALWRADRLQAEFSGEVGQALLSRYGFYEKELFAGAGSYGASRQIRLDTYALRMAAGWTFSPRSYLELRLASGRENPAIASLFVQPLYNNRTVDQPLAEQYWSVQLGYRQRGDMLDSELTLFLNRRADGIHSTRYYDDLAASYADMTLAGLATQALGVEGALQWRVSYRWTLSAAASWGSYRYVADPVVTILRDTDNAPIDVGAVSHLRDCRVGGAPAWTALAAVRYYGARGWGFRLSGGCAGNRYVDPAPLRRTDRVARQNGVTPETFAAFTTQERLQNAFTIDLSLFKSFRFDRSSLLLSLHANNLTGGSYPSYGYESLRSQRLGVEHNTVRIPQATRYLYAQPRSCTLRVSWQF